MPKEKDRKKLDQEAKICSWVNTKFKKSYVAKAPLMVEWKKYMRAYKGDLFIDGGKPDYKSDEVSNYIFSVIEAIRPIMTDNNPKFLALPNTPQGAEISSDIQVAFDYEWNREKMTPKLTRQLVNFLVYGNAVWFLPWNAYKKEVEAIVVNPFNIFPDPIAEDIDGCEYFIYATYKSENELKKMYPDRADEIDGQQVNFSELVNDRDKDAIDSNNQVLILECYLRDYAKIEVENEDGEKKEKMKYPNGRIITCLPDLNIVLEDKKNPYKDGKFPFVLMKCYDMPNEFWGFGEVSQLISPQKYINDLNNQIIDNAKMTANMPWIVDKNAGIGYGKLTNRPGLVIRKTPGSTVTREVPPSMPQYVNDKIIELKGDIEQISGVHDSMRGDKEKGVVAAQAILALQEASQARVRMKIKLMESSLSELATMWYKRMQQYWKVDKWVRITDIEGSTSFRQITPEMLINDFDVIISSGSTMPTNKNATLDLMIRLGQTMAEDGLPVVDRKAILEYTPISDKRAVMQRIEAQKNLQQQIANSQMQMQNDAQQIQMLAQEKQEMVNIVKELIAQIQEIGNEVHRVSNEHENLKRKDEAVRIENKGYERGLKDGARTNQDSVEKKPGKIKGGKAIESITGTTDDPAKSEGFMFGDIEPRAIRSRDTAEAMQTNVEQNLPLDFDETFMQSATYPALVEEQNQIGGAPTGDVPEPMVPMDLDTPQLDDETLQEIMNLSEDELAQLLAIMPELEEVLMQMFGGEFEDEE